MPIYDQFELAETAEYSGSYTDVVIRGDIFQTNFKRRKVISTISSGIISSSINDGIFLYSEYVYLSNSLQSGNDNQFLILADRNERFYDSVLPHPVEYVLSNGGRLVLCPSSAYQPNPEYQGIPQVGNSSSYGFLIGSGLGFATSSFYSYEDSSTIQVADTKWMYKYPFEQTYKTLPRLKNPSYKNGKTYDVIITGSWNNTFEQYWDALLNPAANTPRQGWHTPNVTSSCDELFSIGFCGKSVFKDRTFIYDTIFVTGSTDILPGGTMWIKTRPSINELYKAFFGFTNQAIRPTSAGGAYIVKGPLPLYASYTGGTNPEWYGTIIRGWKYGLHSGLPSYGKIYFRRNKFGQFRDMLEQRPFSKFYIEDNNTILDSAVKILFATGSNAYVTASNYLLNTTDSGIYDIEYKSGQPFTDP